MPDGTDKIPKPLAGKEITPEMITVIPTPKPKFDYPEHYVRPKGKRIMGQDWGCLMVPRHGGY